MASTRDRERDTEREREGEFLNLSLLPLNCKQLSTVLQTRTLITLELHYNYIKITLKFRVLKLTYTVKCLVDKVRFHLFLELIII